MHDPTLPAPAGAPTGPASGQAAPLPPVVQVIHRGPGVGRIAVALILALTALVAVLGVGMVLGAVTSGAVGAWLVGTSAIDARIDRAGSGGNITVLPIRGVIDEAQVAFVDACVDEILADSAVDAVVLRVDSPGGGVTSSDEIWYSITKLKDAGMPVIASFGGVAASGGYYVSCQADAIVAQKTTITGSIGVIAQIMTFGDLMEKIGVEPVTLVATSSPQKPIANDLFRDWTDADRDKVLGMLDSSYDIFRQRVTDGRAGKWTSDTTIDDVADGSVFTADEALALGLVDAIGYLDDAIVRAEQAAGRRPGRATVRTLLPRTPLLGGLARMERRGQMPPLDADRIRAVVNELGRVQLMYLAP